MVQFFGGTLLAYGILLWAYEAAVGWFGSIWGGIVGVFSVVAGWFGGYSEELGML